VPRNYKEDNWGKTISSIQEPLKKNSVGREPPFREELSLETVD
jgi:hypothetical protein